MENPKTLQFKPQAGGQIKFLQRWEFEALGGGSAGGGKSYVLVIDALGIQYRSVIGRAAIEVPEYRGVLFRRETPQLAKLLDIAHEVYPKLGGVFTARSVGDPGASYRFPSGAKIFFCHLENEEDKRNHQGLEYQFAGFDELTHFTLTQYLYIFSRMRSTIPGLTPRVRSTANPEGEGLWWVKKRFVQNIVPGTSHYWLADENPDMNPAGVEVKKGHKLFKEAVSRVFIPMRLQENKILQENDPLYATRIKQLGKRMEKALLDGDWDAFGGEFFAEFDRGAEIIPAFPIPKEWRLILSVDPGYSSPCSVGLQAINHKGELYRIATYYQAQRSPEQHAIAVRDFIVSCKHTRGKWPDIIVSDPSAFAKRDRFAVRSTDKSFADIFAEYDIHLQPGLNDRIQGWWMMRNLMPKRYFVFRGDNDPLLEEMMAAVPDEKMPEDLQGRGNDPKVKDHALDEARYAVMAAYDAAEAIGTDKSWEYRFLKARRPAEQEGYFVGAR